MVRLATTTIETSRETKNVARAVRLSTWYARGIRDTNEVVIYDPSTVLVSQVNDCSDCPLVAYQRGGVCKVGCLAPYQIGLRSRVSTRNNSTTKG